MELLTYPNKMLSTVCKELDEDDFNCPEFHYDIRLMSKNVVLWNGYALAAPQVGILKRFFVISGVGSSKEEELMDKPKIICNPRIIHYKNIIRP